MRLESVWCVRVSLFHIANSLRSCSWFSFLRCGSKWFFNLKLFRTWISRRGAFDSWMAHDFNFRTLRVITDEWWIIQIILMLYGCAHRRTNSSTCHSSARCVQCELVLVWAMRLWLLLCAIQNEPSTVCMPHAVHLRISLSLSLLSLTHSCQDVRARFAKSSHGARSTNALSNKSTGSCNARIVNASAKQSNENYRSDGSVFGK